jgi:hypothetical protein
MKIGMDHFFILDTRLASTAGIIIRSVFAAYIPGISQGQGKRTASFRSGEELGMAYPFFLYRTDKP